MRTLTHEELRAAIKQILLNARPKCSTAGEITKELENLDFDIKRSAVKRHLEFLVGLGEARVEHWPVERHGVKIPRAAHYGGILDDSFTPEEDPFARFDED